MATLLFGGARSVPDADIEYADVCCGTRTLATLTRAGVSVATPAQTLGACIEMCVSAVARCWSSTAVMADAVPLRSDDAVRANVGRLPVATPALFPLLVPALAPPLAAVWEATPPGLPCCPSGENDEPNPPAPLVACAAARLPDGTDDDEAPAPAAVPALAPDPACAPPYSAGVPDERDDAASGGPGGST